MSPKQFYVQLVSKEDEIAEMIDTVTGVYEALGETDQVLSSVAVGQICCAKFGDEGWYR